MTIYRYNEINTNKMTNLQSEITRKLLRESVVRYLRFPGIPCKFFKTLIQDIYNKRDLRINCSHYRVGEVGCVCVGGWGLGLVGMRWVTYLKFVGATHYSF